MELHYLAGSLVTTTQQYSSGATQMHKKAQTHILLLGFLCYKSLKGLPSFITLFSNNVMWSGWIIL